MRIKVIVWHDDGTKQEMLFPEASGINKTLVDDRTVLDIWGKGSEDGPSGSW